MTRFKIPLGPAILAGGLFLNLWAGVGIVTILETTTRTLFSAPFWLLLAITALIFEFGRHLSEPENADEFISVAHRIGGRHGRTWSLMTVPAMIGLVPMPAGALFSAPVVQQTAREDSWRPEWKAAVNYWFRHTWEYWWPLYPSIIMTLSIFDIDVQKFIMAQLPFTIVSALIGYIVLIRPHVETLASGAETYQGKNGWRCFKVLLPLMIVVPCVIFLPQFLAMLFPDMDKHTGRQASMLTGVVIGLIPIMIQERKKENNMFLKGTFSRRCSNVLLTIAGILLFQALLETSGLLPLARQELRESGIPVVVVIALLPFLAGFVTGIALGFAGTAFPLVAMLAGADAAQMPIIAVIALAFGFGYMGMILSPVHLCLVVSCDYFAAHPFRFYRCIAPCIVVMMVFTILTTILYCFIS